MKYPRRSPYIYCWRIGRNEYVIEDFWNSEQYLANYETAAFLKRLDGKHSPYSLLPGCSRRYVRRFMKELKVRNLLATNDRLIKLGIGHYMYPLATCHPGKALKWFAMMMNRILMTGFIPMLAWGIYLNNQGIANAYMQNKGEIFLAMIIGALSGIILHEFSHACAGIAYNGRQIEMGVGIYFFMPIGWVLIDDGNEENRLHNIQETAAGLEMNLFLYGVFMWLSAKGIFNPFIMKTSGTINLVMAIINALPLDRLDGMQILSIVSGKEDILKHAKTVIRNRKKHRRKPVRNVGRRIAVAASYGLVGFQAVFPLLLILEVISLIWLIIL